MESLYPVSQVLNELIESVSINIEGRTTDTAKRGKKSPSVFEKSIIEEVFLVESVLFRQ